jgi:hypothetical protein
LGYSHKYRSPKNKVPTHYLVCWPEEKDTLSTVSVKKIVILGPDDLASDTFCKVKGWEKYMCKGIALGSEREVKITGYRLRAEGI